MKSIKTTKIKFMNKMMYLFLLFASVAIAQPAINNPTSLLVCDPDGDGFTTFNLDSKKAQILGALNPTQNIVTFHLSQIDANNNTQAITNSNAFINTVASLQLIYVRVTDTNNAFATTTFFLSITDGPSLAAMPPTINKFDVGIFDGFSNFNLTIQTPIIIGNELNYTVTYFLTEIDAQSNTNPIVNSSNFGCFKSYSKHCNFLFDTD